MRPTRGLGDVERLRRPTVAFFLDVVVTRETNSQNTTPCSICHENIGVPPQLEPSDSEPETDEA